MNTSEKDAASEQVPEESHYALPKDLPRPTFWPISLALGITFLLWGFISSIIISFVGLAVMAVSLAGWLGEFRDE
jgi:hypothetical protein